MLHLLGHGLSFNDRLFHYDIRFLLNRSRSLYRSCSHFSGLSLFAEWVNSRSFFSRRSNCIFVDELLFIGESACCDVLLGSVLLLVLL
jgi:hypothetical protein